MSIVGTKHSATVIASKRFLEDEIRRRAYELYEERGRENGDELDDWLRAETELMAETLREAALNQV
jgi:hypothetical protein